MVVRGVPNGRNYIVSVAITPEMHHFLNTKKKGSRSAFLRRAIYNAEKYDHLNKVADQEYEKMTDARDHLLVLVAWQQARLNSILSTGEDKHDFVQWVLSEGSSSPTLAKHPWSAAR